MSSPRLSGPDFIAFVVDDVEAAVAPGGFVVTVHAGAP